MNIAITSPEKFKLQDLVCIELMFRFLGNDAAVMYVEPPGGEDGELQVPEGRTKKVVELQVKGSHQAVQLSSIAECLLHFPPHKDHGPLLERLYHEPHRMALLVFSGRCNDAASVFLSDPEWVGQPHPASRITESVIKEFCKTCLLVEPAGTKGSKLQARRKESSRSFADSADTTLLGEALRRIIVIEWRRKKDIVAACHLAMQGIPFDRLTDVLNRVLDHITTCKGQLTDAYPHTRAILSEARGANIRPADYVPRGDEPMWLEILSKDRVLLLTGRTRVGKSDAGRWIASEFSQKGYDVRSMFEVEVAERFLQESSNGPRLVLLDDPLIFDGSQAPKALRGLERIVSRLKTQDALIVSQGQEALLDAAGKATVTSISTGGRRWIDLSEYSPEFQTRVWLQHAQLLNVPQKLMDDVDSALRSGLLNLEPGCLAHLAAHHHRLPVQSRLDSIERLAREDAESFGRTLRDEGCEEVLLALLVGSSAAERMNNETTAFVLGAGGMQLPGEQINSARVIMRKDAAEQFASEMQYESASVLTSFQENRLEYLETHRIVSVTSEGTAFTHPFYRAAAGWATQPRSTGSSARLISVARRAIFCRNPKVSRAAARNLDALYASLAGRPEQFELVLQAIAGVTRCKYVATRDLCLAFLLRHLRELPADLQDNVGTWVSSADLGLKSLIWVEGEAYAFDGIEDSDDMWEAYRTIDRSEVIGALTAMRGESPIAPTHEQAIKLARYFQGSPNDADAADIKFFLQRDEAAIRATAARWWLSADRMDDADVLGQIFGDSHPSVVKASLEGCIRGWHDFKESRQQDLLAWLASVCSTPAGAASALTVLTVFDRVEYTGPRERTPWKIFETIFPGVIRSLPSAAMFNDARLYDVIERSIKFIPRAASLEILDSMIEWLIQQTARGKVLSDFEAGMVTLLIKATRDAPEMRGDRVQRLLEAHGTAAILRIVADLISDWALLTLTERKLVLDLLGKSRRDQRWIRAVALTRAGIPDEVLAAAARTPVDMRSARSVLSELSPEVFEAAVAVFCGEPQPLWWIGTHHASGTVWDEIIELAALDGSRPTFETAWAELIRRGESSASFTASIVAKVDAVHLDRVFSILLRKKVHTTGDFLMPVWMTLLNRRDNSRIAAEWREDLDACLPVILDRLGALAEWLEEPYRADAEKLLATDQLPLMMVGVVKQSLGDKTSGELIPQVTRAVIAFLYKQPPRLFKTYDVLLSVFSSEGWKSESVLQLAKQRRDEIFEKREAIREEYEFVPNLPEDWIHP